MLRNLRVFLSILGYHLTIFIIVLRVDALRQERMESPGKGLSTTMISPTQVVLGRSAPYFVPSGERAQGPIINQNATPEHVSEPDKVATFF